MKLSTVIKFKEELNEIKSKGLTLAQYCSQTNKNRAIYSTKIKNIIESRDLFIQEAGEVIKLYNELTDNRSPKKDYYEELAASLLNGETTEDDKTAVIYIRNKDTNLIAGYDVTVYVRDSNPFKVILSRTEVETLFGLYTYYGGNITARNVANEFPRFTLPEIKKLFRAFKLTKDSAWFPPHLNEELSEDELCQYRMNLKERAAFKYADARQEKDFKNVLNKLACDLNKALDRKEIIKDLNLSDFSITPTISKNSKSNKRDIIVYLSDIHIGAYNENNGYEKLVSYNEADIRHRLNTVLNKLNKNYDNIIICNLGDSIDSYKKETTRGGHLLPNNSTDKEKSSLFIKLMMEFFTSLKQISNSVYYYCVGESNHKINKFSIGSI